MVGDLDGDVEGVVGEAGAADGFGFTCRSFPLNGSLTTAVAAAVSGLAGAAAASDWRRVW